MVVPDNLKTGVEKTEWYTPVINRTYNEMAEHYGTAIVPARVRKPRDKTSVESTVGDLSTWITAALRNPTYFSVAELNGDIAKKLTDDNARPFQKRPGSRAIKYCRSPLLRMRERSIRFSGKYSTNPFMRMFFRLRMPSNPWQQ